MNDNIGKVIKGHDFLKLIRDKAENALIRLEGHSEVPQKVYDASVDILKTANNLVEYFEDNDENMKVGAIEPVDKFFKDNPITEYVDAAVDLLQGKISNEEAAKRMREAAEKVEGQKEVQESVEPIEKFVLSIVNDIPFDDSQVIYKKDFTEALLDAVKQLKNKSGFSRFAVITANGGFGDGSISSNHGQITVGLLDKVYNFPELPKEEEAGCTGDPETCKHGLCYPDCCEEEEIDYSNRDDVADDDFKSQSISDKCNPCDGSCIGCPDRGEDEKLIDYVRVFDEETAVTTFELMDSIEKELSSRTTEYTKDDVELIRFYLRNLPHNSVYSIEELEDSAVIMAWKMVKYVKGQ